MKSLCLMIRNPCVYRISFSSEEIIDDLDRSRTYKLNKKHRSDTLSLLDMFNVDNRNDNNNHKPNNFQGLSIPSNDRYACSKSHSSFLFLLKRLLPLKKAR